MSEKNAKRVVWKFAMSLVSKHQIPMPSGAKVLHFGVQGGAWCIWAECDPDAASETRRFRVVGTGHREIEEGDKYIGTVMDGAFVWHLYETGGPR